MGAYAHLIAGDGRMIVSRDWWIRPPINSRNRPHRYALNARPRCTGTAL